MMGELKITDDPKNKRNTAAIRLNDAELAEMESMGIQTPSEYLRIKLNRNKQIELFPSSSSKVDVNKEIQLARLEMELTNLKKENDILKNSSHDGLGKVDVLVKEGIDRELKEREFNELKLNNQKLKLRLRKEREEVEKLTAENEGFKKQLKTVEVVKDVSPHVGPLLGLLGNALKAAQNGGGLSGFLSGFGGEATQEVKLSAEDEQALSLGKQITSLFTPEEQQQVIACLAVFSQDKKMILVALKFMDKYSREFKKDPEPKSTDATNDGGEEYENPPYTGDDNPLNF